MNLGKIIYENRRKLNLTQRELGDKLSVSDKQISKWETGASYPDITIINALASALEITTNELLGAEDMHTQNTLNKKTDYQLLLKMTITLIVSVALLLVVMVFYKIGEASLRHQQIFYIIAFLLCVFSMVIQIIMSLIHYNQIRNEFNQGLYLTRFYYLNASYITVYLVFLLILFTSSLDDNFRFIAGILMGVGVVLYKLLQRKTSQKPKYKVLDLISFYLAILMTSLMVLTIILSYFGYYGREVVVGINFMEILILGIPLLFYLVMRYFMVLKE